MLHPQSCLSPPSMGLESSLPPKSVRLLCTELRGVPHHSGSWSRRKQKSVFFHPEKPLDILWRGVGTFSWPCLRAELSSGLSWPRGELTGRCPVWSCGSSSGRARRCWGTRGRRSRWGTAPSCGC